MPTLLRPGKSETAECDSRYEITPKQLIPLPSQGEDRLERKIEKRLCGAPHVSAQPIRVSSRKNLPLRCFFAEKQPILRRQHLSMTKLQPPLRAHAQTDRAATHFYIGHNEAYVFPTGLTSVYLHLLRRWATVRNDENYHR